MGKSNIKLQWRQNFLGNLVEIPGELSSIWRDVLDFNPQPQTSTPTHLQILTLLHLTPTFIEDTPSALSTAARKATICGLIVSQR